MRYVDVNVLIYWLGNDPLFGNQATKIVERIEKGERAVTSSLTLWLAHVLLSSLAERYSEEEFVKKVRDLIFLRVEPCFSKTTRRPLNT